MVETEPTQTTIRIANYDEGEAIHQLCLASGMWEVNGLDWSRISGWIVADDEQGLVGCIQVCVACPISRVELLFVHPRATHREKAILCRDLVAAAFAVAKMGGASAVHTTIPDHYPDEWRKVIARRDAVEWYHGISYLRWL